MPPVPPEYIRKSNPRSNLVLFLLVLFAFGCLAASHVLNALPPAFDPTTLGQQWVFPWMP